METFTTVTALMAVAVGLAVAARWLRLPYAVALVLAGMALAVIPGVPSVTLDPHLAMAFFLPPLLQASAFFTPLRDFRRNLRPILLLAVGLVGFTTICIGWVTKQLLPDLPWAVCFAFGALIAPPDAAAAAAVMSAIAVPRRVVTILEGESLLNDASGLVLYNFAIAAAATGAFSAWGAAGAFTLLAAGGLAIGWLCGRLATLLSARLDDPLLEITVSFLVAFGSYAAAETVHASGVLAVVACGITVAWHAPEWMTPRTRLEAKAVWDFAVFVLNTVVFTLIGMELRGVIARSGGSIDWGLVGIGLLIAGVLVVSRFVWVFPVAYGHRLLLPKVRAIDPYPPWRNVVVISWAGMRGVVSMAAAIGIPESVPGRDAVLALTFIAIFVTLVLQATTLGPLVRLLKLAREAPSTEAHARLRRRLADAAVDHLAQLHEDEMVGPFARELTPHYAAQAAANRLRSDNPAAAEAEFSAILGLKLQTLAAQRALLLRLYRTREVDDHAMRALEGELDLEELRLHRLRGGFSA
jgi:CPA1 family monovalent cation:H+ antiporter